MPVDFRVSDRFDITAQLMVEGHMVASGKSSADEERESGS